MVTARRSAVAGLSALTLTEGRPMRYSGRLDSKGGTKGRAWGDLRSEARRGQETCAERGPAPSATSR
jgi:hypothetical protein